MTPGVIATSPLVRCVETAEILAAALDGPKVVELDELQPGSDLQGLLRWTARQAAKHEQIAWVGHVPDVNRLVAALIGDGGSLIHFAKGAVAAIRFDGEPTVGAASCNGWQRRKCLAADGETAERTALRHRSEIACRRETPPDCSRGALETGRTLWRPALRRLPVLLLPPPLLNLRACILAAEAVAVDVQWSIDARGRAASRTRRGLGHDASTNRRRRARQIPAADD